MGLIWLILLVLLIFVVLGGVFIAKWVFVLIVVLIILAALSYNRRGV